VTLRADMEIGPRNIGVVIFALGGPGRCGHPRNRFVGDYFKSCAIGTLFIDLLTPEEEAVDTVAENHRNDTALLASRLCAATQWLIQQKELHGGAPVGFYGGDTAAEAVLVAAEQLQREIAAIVLRGGDLDSKRDHSFQKVTSPTLLLVGERDEEFMKRNEEAAHHLRCHRQLVIIPGASHLLEEPASKNRVLTLASDWFAERFIDWEHASHLKG